MDNSKSIKKNSNKSTSADLNMDFLIAQYQALASRQLNHSSILWSIPTILFVGQTLLWNIALDIDVPVTFRRLIAVVALLISIMAYQLCLRNKKKEIADRKQLYSIEKFMIKKYGHEGAMVVFESLNKRTLLAKDEKKLNQMLLGNKGECSCKILDWLSNLSSFYTGTIIFISFVIASLAILFYTCFLI